MDGKDRRQDDAARLLGVVAAMARELRPGLAPSGDSGLDQSFERELGFDSLTRMELLHRLEEEFGLALPETVLAQAETPRDLLRAIAAAGQQTASSPADQALSPTPTAPAPTAPTPTAPAPGPPVGGARMAPASLTTLGAVLAWHAEHHGARPHIHLCADQARETISYAALWSGAERIAAGLASLDLRPDEAVAIMLPTGADYFFCFMGVLLAGAIPVPIYPPGRPSQLAEHLDRHSQILANCQARLLVAEPAAKEFSGRLEARLEDLRAVVTPAELASAQPGPPLPARGAAHIALLQYTSGSTGDPKGVVLSNANLLANIRAMGQALGAGPEDVFVSWLPLYHDMGLIGAWLGSLVHAMPLAVMSPLSFLARPHRWLAAIDEFGGTLSGGPNFAYEACVKRIDQRDIEGLDLSSWRVAFNGAEPVSAKTMHAFAERFAPLGFHGRALMPVYGLAENAVGLSFPPPGRGPLIDRIDRQRFLKTGRAEAAGAEMTGTAVMEVPGCGPPLPGHEIRIMEGGPSGGGGEAAERREGRLQFRGPSASSGYYRNPEASALLFQDGWLDTGDLAYLAGGEVYLTGRTKDMIVKAGRNIFPAELEAAVGEIEGVQKGGVAVFASTDPQSGTERLVVMAETRRRGEAEGEEIRRQVIALAADLVGTPPDLVELVAPRGVPKTSSGKIRRQAARLIFEAGGASGAGGAGGALSGLWLDDARARLRRGARRLAIGAYGLWAWALLCLIAPAAWLAIAAIPHRGWAWGLTRSAFGLIRALLGVRLEVEGAENLCAARPCLILTNHCSYLDGAALILALPGQFAFVVKAELKRALLPRLFLTRLGALFVERFEATRGIADAAAASARALAGHTLVFFPEGTFTRAPGLLPFQMGAFTTAVAAGLPVLPITLRGTRAMLRDGTWLPRPGTIRVRIGRPIAPPTGPEAQAEGDWARAVSLRDRARREILAHLGEPDLATHFSPLAALRANSGGANSGDDDSGDDDSGGDTKC